MARFEITTPAPGFTGESRGIAFQQGKAVVTSDTKDGLSALTYFYGAGYGVLPLDGVTAAEIVQRGNESPEEEAARLDREIAELDARRSLDDKRAKRDALYREVYGDEAADAREAAAEPVDETTTLTTGIAPTVATAADGDPGTDSAEPGEGASSELLAPPAGNASVDDWRTWAVDSGRAQDSDVASMSRTAIQQRYGADYDRDREAQLKGGESA
jgi:hypothetical protein